MLAFYLAMLDTEDDRALFSRLYNENHIDMIRYAESILKDYHAAEDVVQEMFYKMVKNIDKYRIDVSAVVTLNGVNETVSTWAENACP